jgi:hypothetical protein
LISQGIGVIESPFRTGGGGFSDGYSDGFDTPQN